MLDREYKFYEENRESLKTRFEKRFLVIVGESVFGEFDSYEKALEEALKSYHQGEFLIQDTLEGDKVHRFHSRVYA